MNQRAHPCLRLDGTHPYHHVWRGAPPRVVEDGPMLPFLSSYTGPDFADRMLPLTYPDWEIATNRVFPGDRHRWPPRRPDASQPWRQRRDVAFFRGSNTGDGTRERLCALHGAVFGGVRIDARITRASRRFRVAAGVVLPPAADVALGKFVPMHAQSQFKYLIVADGHSAPNRVATLLLTGCLILRVRGRSAGRHVWVDRYLEPMVHFVPVRADLSDLEERLRWAASHPRECEALARAGVELGCVMLPREFMVEAARGALLGGP